MKGATRRRGHARGRGRVIAIATLLVAAGCGFPSVAFDSSDASGPDDGAGGSPEAAADAAGAPDGSSDAGDGGASDAHTADATSDAQAGKDATVDAAAPDASNGDATFPDVVAPDTGAGDAATADGQPPDASGTGSPDAGVNCDCGAGAMIPTHVTCGALSGSILDCTGAAGFTDDGPPCGQSSNTYVTCPSGINVTCTGVASTMVQHCL